MDLVGPAKSPVQTNIVSLSKTEQRNDRIGRIRSIVQTTGEAPPNQPHFH